MNHIYLIMFVVLKCPGSQSQNYGAPIHVYIYHMCLKTGTEFAKKLWRGTNLIVCVSMTSPTMFTQP